MAARDHVFISYRRSDSSSTAGRLRDTLTNAFGVDAIFQDVSGITMGAPFPAVLRAEIDRAAVVVVVIEESWLKAADEDGRRRLDSPKDWVRIELLMALASDDILVIPLLIAPARPPTARALPKALQSLAHINSYSIDVATWDRDLEPLIDRIAVQLDRRSTPRPGSEGGVGDLVALRSGTCEIGPLTLSAVLAGSTEHELPVGYPTGTAGAHLVFDVYNPNQVELAVLAVELEVISYRPLELEYLLHGVGATGVKRRFYADVASSAGRYSARYTGGADAAEYVRLLPEETEAFDLEVAAAHEGLYAVCVHLVGSMAGSRVDAAIETTRCKIAFFDRKSNYRIDRGTKFMRYDDYIAEMSTFDPDLRRY